MNLTLVEFTYYITSVLLIIIELFIIALFTGGISYYLIHLICPSAHMGFSFSQMILYYAIVFCLFKVTVTYVLLCNAIHYII